MEWVGSRGRCHLLKTFPAGGITSHRPAWAAAPELGRVAYVNFRHPQDSREARQHALARQLLLYDRPLKVEPVYLRGGGGGGGMLLSRFSRVRLCATP